MCVLATIKNSANEDVKVADIKKDYILNIINACKLCPGIKKVVLFGSSIEDRCKPASDIDIAVFGNDTRSKMLRSKSYKNFADSIFTYGFEQDYDILYFNINKPGSASILQDISHGIVLYERG